MKYKNTIQIYVYLPDEAVDVWRPVEAIQEGENLYRIISLNVFDDENWQFKFGELVRCKEKAPPKMKHTL